MIAVLKGLKDFFFLIPELLELVRVIKHEIREVQTTQKVKEDVKKVTEAFKEKDAEKLKSIFNS